MRLTSDKPNMQSKKDRREYNKGTTASRGDSNQTPGGQNLANLL